MPVQPGQRSDGLPGFLFRASQVVEALQVEPELRACAEKMAEAQSGIAGDRACAIQDLRHAIGWHAYSSRQLRRAHIENLQFLGQVLTWMDCAESHNDSPSDNQQFRRLTALASGLAIQNKSAIDR
jgi:hypothetical protein